MGHIINKKKRGRPPKSDLSTRTRDLEPESDSRVRRSLRRRNVRYNFIDYDDFIDDGFFEEEDEDEEEQSRREKKVKLVVKLNQASRDDLASGSEDEANEEDEEEDDEDEGSERRVVKKRRISGCEEDEEEEELENGEARRLVKGNLKKLEPLPLPETPIGAPTQVPLPDKKKLELILDKLQKKDTYGVYAEPVDPEELPDYHDVIEHPMDFSTVRKKLANGSYSILDQIESDIFLICSNAMRYNSPETIYHKQARIIQELGQKKFHKLRIDYERAEQELKLEYNSRVDFDGPEKEPKSDQRAKSSLMVKKQMKKPVPRYMQEPIGSDFSAGAVLAGDLQSNVSSANQVGNLERHVYNEGILESSSVVAGNNLDKAEELSIERSIQPKLWRKPSTVDENLRATYIISNQPAVKEESTFTTFDGESRQLIAVGLHAEYSYARSLSRFAATLGPIAWRVASQRIEEVVPSGCKFGRGWVDEYEPAPTPVLLLEHPISRDSSLLGFGSRKKEGVIKKTPEASNSSKEKLVNSSGKFEVKPSLLRADTVPYTVASSPGLRPSNTAAVHTNNYRTETPVLRSFGGTGNRVVKQFELNSLPSPNQCNADYVAEKKPLSDKVNTAAAGPRFGEIVSSKEVSEAGVVGSRFRGPSGGLNNNTRFESLRSRGDVAGKGLTNGKIASSNSSSEYNNNNRVSSPSSTSGVPNEMLPRPPYPAGFFLRQDQGGLSDPVQLMRVLAGKASQQQQEEENCSNNVVDPSPMMMRRGDDSRGNNSAATAAASVWMSIGATGFKQAGGVAAAENSSSPKRSQTPPTTDSSSFHTAHYEQPNLQQQQLQAARGVGGEVARFQHGSPYPSYVQVASGGNNEVQQQQQLSNRHMVFPQLMNANFSRLQPPQMMMPSWRGISPHAQQQQQQIPPPHPKAKQESHLPPPDLNIGFQSPVGSPVTQSSGAVKMMDSQQPDLALQL